MTTTFYTSRTKAQLRSELDRIASSDERSGPVFGEGSHNYQTASRFIVNELARRGDVAEPAKKPEQAASILDPGAIYNARRTAAPVDTGNTDGDHPDGQAVKSAEQLEAMRESIYAARRKPDITDQANIFPNRQELEL